MNIYDIFGNVDSGRLASLCIHDDGRKEWSSFNLGNLFVSNDVKTSIEQAVGSHPNEVEITFRDQGFVFKIRKRIA